MATANTNDLSGGREERALPCECCITNLHMVYSLTNPQFGKNNPYSVLMLKTLSLSNLHSKLG